MSLEKLKHNVVKCPTEVPVIRKGRAWIMHACIHASIHPPISPSIHPSILPFIHPSMCTCMQPIQHTLMHTHPGPDTMLNPGVTVVIDRPYPCSLKPHSPIKQINCINKMCTKKEIKYLKMKTEHCGGDLLGARRFGRFRDCPKMDLT